MLDLRRIYGSWGFAVLGDGKVSPWARGLVVPLWRDQVSQVIFFKGLCPYCWKMHDSIAAMVAFYVLSLLFSSLHHYNFSIFFHHFTPRSSIKEGNQHTISWSYKYHCKALVKTIIYPSVTLSWLWGQDEFDLWPLMLQSGKFWMPLQMPL